jgi:hypothetical protein
MPHIESTGYKPSVSLRLDDAIRHCEAEAKRIADMLEFLNGIKRKEETMDVEILKFLSAFKEKRKTMKTLIIAASREVAKRIAIHRRIHAWTYLCQPHQLYGIDPNDVSIIAGYGWWNNPAADEFERFERRHKLKHEYIED